MKTEDWDPDNGEASDDIDNGRTFVALSLEEFLEQLDPVPDSTKHLGKFEFDNIDPR